MVGGQIFLTTFTVFRDFVSLSLSFSLGDSIVNLFLRGVLVQVISWRVFGPIRFEKWEALLSWNQATCGGITTTIPVFVRSMNNIKIYILSQNRREFKKNRQVRKKFISLANFWKRNSKSKNSMEIINIFNAKSKVKIKRN